MTQPHIVTPESAGQRTSLRITQPGLLDSLELVLCPRQAPDAGEVEIQVVASAINFIDVLAATGYSPVDAPELGLDCAGVVSRVGAGVSELAVGDRVAAFAEGSFSSYVTVSAARVLRVPERMSFEQAATLPVAYLTAWYGLSRLARLTSGERVLIHSAAGGVGNAAIAVARHLGAEIFATAGTKEKRDWLADLGIGRVLDSRSVAFVDGIREITAGDGVDVVLNSLPGESIQAGLELLRIGGRFIELGKRDIYGGGVIALSPFRRNLSLHSVDLLLLGRVAPGLIRSLLNDLQPLFDARSLGPVDHSTFPIADAAAAFRRMTTGRHIGKVVTTFP